jgi:hypothetical protein
MVPGEVNRGLKKRIWSGRLSAAIPVSASLSPLFSDKRFPVNRRVLTASRLPATWHQLKVAKWFLTTAHHQT